MEIIGDPMKLKLPKIKKVRLRMTLYFTILVVFVILIINFFTGLIFTNELVRQTDSVVQRKMHTIVGDIHGKITSIRALCSDIQEDSEIVDLVTLNKNVSKFDELTYRERRVPYLVEKHSANNMLISKIILVDSNDNILDLNESNKESRNNIINDIDFAAFSENSYFEDFSISKMFPVTRNGYISGNEHYINYFTKMWDKRYNRIGRIIICVDPSNLFNYTEVFCREIFDSAYILNSRGELVYNTGPIGYDEEIRKLGYEGNNPGLGKIKTIDHEKYLVFTKPLSYNTDWKLVGIVSYERLVKNAKVMSMAIYLIGIICIIAVVIVSSYIAKSITKPVIKVNKAILKLDAGEWPEPVNVKSEDELKHLVEGFNRMVKSLQNSFNKIYEEEESKKRAEIKALQFQLELLQSQINPHFIYNTLNTFSFLALKNGDERLRELIQSFNLLLRSSISVDSDLITIAKELELTDRYLKIQECRYGSIFHISYSAPEDILQFKIPKLILQPLVENSLFHGISPKGTEGCIKIEFVKETASIGVKVIDDGVGINESDIPDILNGKRREHSKGFSNIGLANINERLKLNFGEEYTLKIFSNLGIGTTVEFHIPLIR